MNSPGMPPIDVTSIRAVSYAEDRQSLVLAVRSKYSGERNYSVPVDCMKTLITDLQRLGSAPDATTGTQSTPTPESLPTVQDAPGRDEKPAQTANRVAARMPQRWMLGTGLPQHPVVLLVFDPQSANQSAYVLAEDAARRMATGLLQQAEHLTQHRSNTGPASPPGPKN